MRAWTICHLAESCRFGGMLAKIPLGRSLRIGLLFDATAKEEGHQFPGPARHPRYMRLIMTTECAPALVNVSDKETWIQKNSPNGADPIVKSQ